MIVNYSNLYASKELRTFDHFEELYFNKTTLSFDTFDDNSC